MPVPRPPESTAVQGPGSRTLTELDDRVHGAHAAQQARQLVLADILQPLVERIAQHLVHTQEPGKREG